MGMLSAVSIFIFSCPALCLIKSEWLQSFPLGFFHSHASLCDLIRCMIHTERSLGFHRKDSHMVRRKPTAQGLRPHTGERRACALNGFVCDEMYIFLPLVLYIDMREVSHSKGPHPFFFSQLYFTTTLICIHGYISFCHYPWLDWWIVWIPPQGCINKLPCKPEWPSRSATFLWQRQIEG